MIFHHSCLVLLGLAVFSTSLQVYSLEILRDEPGPQAEITDMDAWDTYRFGRNVPQAERARDAVKISREVPQAEVPSKNVRNLWNVPQAERALNKRDPEHEVKRSSDACLWRCNDHFRACRERCTTGDKECVSVCHARYSGMHCWRKCREGDLDKRRDPQGEDKKESAVQ